MMNDPDLLNEVFWFCVGLGFLFAALMALVAKKEIKAYDRAFKQIVREQEALGVHGPNTPYVSKNTKIIEGEI